MAVGRKEGRFWQGSWGERVGGRGYVYVYVYVYGSGRLGREERKGEGREQAGKRNSPGK